MTRRNASNSNWGAVGKGYRKEMSQSKIAPRTNIEDRVRVPRKTQASKPEVRFSTHKKRAVWFQSRTCWPVRDAPIEKLIEARAEARRSPEAEMTARWISVGPTNIGGRTTSLICHPDNPDVIWIGAAGGGVWHSTDAGLTWSPQWHEQDILNIGALALDPQDPNVLYCGTGEADLSDDSYPGVGLFKSIDSGTSWRLLAGAEDGQLPRRIGAIALDPFDSRHIIVGGVGFNESSASGHDLGGLYSSRDGGSTWSREITFATNNYWCHAVVFHPRKSGRIFTTITEQGSRSGIWRSLDGGQSWEHLTKGLPAPACFGRTSLAISPSDPDVIYAFAESENIGQADLLLGVFRSSDEGDSWADVSGNHFRKEGQISYGNCIAVHPSNPDIAICGGVDLHLTKNGGKTWKKVSHWDVKRGKTDYAHADHHAVVMPLAKPARIYSANDGGMDISEDTGTTWKNRSKGLAATMFYDMDVAQSDGRNFGGGAQDNGTLVTANGSADDYFEKLGGDGGWIVYDPHDATRVYASMYNMQIYRFRNGRVKDVSPPAREADSIWMCYITMDPAKPTTVYTGSSRIWRTTNDGAKWEPISSVLDGSPITAIEVAESDSRRIYVGTENGGFFRSIDGGQTWSPNLSSSVLPGYQITRLETNAKTGADLLFATVANFGRSHVYRSQDGGLTWADIDRGQLPNVPHHAILILPKEPKTLFVGNDVGVFVSKDGGDTWANMTLNMPNVMVVDLVYHTKQKMLYAATYGRSIWRIRI
jgi:photosystem II stability/assembly factor-like uncharacterized protein